MGHGRNSFRASDTLVCDPRLLDRVGHDFAARHGIVPVRKAGAMTIVAARDMWARLDTIDHLENRLGPVTFVPAPRKDAL